VRIGHRLLRDLMSLATVANYRFNEAQIRVAAARE